MDESNRKGVRWDEVRMQWLEDHLTLHKQVELLYVVDGYEVTTMDDSKPGSERVYRGETLRDAIDAAIGQSQDGNCIQTGDDNG